MPLVFFNLLATKASTFRIKGAEYQQGVQSDFWNVREYVLYRDNHKCRYCKGKSKDRVLNVHHLESRKTGGNSPDNLITLCETCHNMYHRGLISLDNVTKGSSYRPETFMSILRKYLIENLRKTYNNVSYTGLSLFSVNTTIY